MLTPNSKNILLITTLVFFYGVHCTQVNFVYLAIEAKIDKFIKMKHECFGDQVSIGSLTPLAIQEYVYFIEIKLFKNYSNFNIEVNGDR